MRKSSILSRRPSGCATAASSQPSRSSDCSALPLPPTKRPLGSDGQAQSQTFEAIYRDVRQNKLGSFDGSVEVSADGSTASLLDEGSKVLVTRKMKGETLSTGLTASFGKWQVELGEPLACSDPPPPPRPVQPPPPSRSHAAAKPAASHRSTAASGSGGGSFKPPTCNSAAGSSGGSFKPPTCNTAAGSSGALPLPPSTEPAVVSAVSGELVLNVGDVGARPVAVDRQLVRALRPHQSEGVQFMWDCCAGRRLGASGHPLTGCILAHSPGLGKTLQAIALAFTMLKQSPLAGRGTASRPLIKKAMIVCPASLCRNWEHEFKRWLPQRLKPALLPMGAGGGSAADAARDFVRCVQPPVLIVSYDALRTHAEVLAEAPIGLLVCDEGHRLKSSAGSLTIDALNRFTRARKIILTGTPMQNDLSEFWAMCNFVAPQELGSLAAFNAAYAGPINAGRERAASSADREHASAATERLRELTEPFVLRRDTSVLRALLPERHEITLFVRLAPEQADAYRAQIRDASLRDPLPAIHRLRAICSYALAREGVGAAGGQGEGSQGDGQHGAAAIAKIRLLMQLLEPVHAAQERVVLCSSFCRSLDVLEAALHARGWGVMRLDGSTPVGMRQALVDRFNTRAGPDTFAFLLSTRAGGTGLNLVGASRMVLLDPGTHGMAQMPGIGAVRPCLPAHSSRGSISPFMYG